MKQHITKKQYNELTKEQENILFESVSQVYSLFDWTPYTIGQMIEFLGEGWEVAMREAWGAVHFGEECDALWEACKRELTKPRK